MAGPAPSRFIRLLRDGGCLRPWLAELADGEDVPAGPPQYHDKDVLGHTMEVMDRLAGDPLLAWMGLCHDLGKTATDPAGWPRHPGHDALGQGLARRLGERLALPNRYIEAGMVAARRHMTAARYAELRPGTRVDLLMHLHQKRLLAPLCALAAADHGRQGPDLLASARADLDTILSVRLDEQDRDRGRHSFDTLRRLRCEALARMHGR
jgi:tRNA nucleotidyltransferase (CCA-adding enzyme)